jgi:diacylglycerol O-acyltransferase
MDATVLEPLGPLDAALLRMETPEVLLHVATLVVLERPADGPAPNAESFVRLIASRLHLVPRYRQRVLEGPIAASAFWVDDPDLDLAYHVRVSALPVPGTTEQLTAHCARILSRPLDRSRPLWELYVIEGLEHGRVALLGKSHHAMIDGLDGVDLITVMLDDSAEPEPVADAPAWEPAPLPGAAELARVAVEGLVARPGLLVERVRAAASAPSRTVRRGLALGASAARVVRSRFLAPAPTSLINRGPGRHRRLAVQRLELADVKAVKGAFSTTVTDVVLAIVSDAVGRYLRDHGARTDGLWLRVLVPVSRSEDAEHHRLRSSVVGVIVELPMAEMDPVERLEACRTAMADVRDRHGAVGAGFLLGLDEFAPPTLHALAARVAADARVFNLAVVNVPGPQRPTHCNGLRLVGAFPFTSLPPGQALGIGVTSIDGGLDVGLIADYDTIPDVTTITDGLVTALAELVACAGAVRA